MTTIDEMTIKEYEIAKLKQECKEKSDFIFSLGECLGQIRDEVANFTDVVIKASGIVSDKEEKLLKNYEVINCSFNSQMDSKDLSAEVILKIKKVKDTAEIPKYQTDGSSGMDLCAAINNIIIIPPLQRVFIPTGIAIELPLGYEAQVRPRSGLSSKHGITLVNCVGTIDSDYRGEIIVPLINLSDSAYSIQPGERIAQMVISRYERVGIKEVNELSPSGRGTGSFGSTGSV